MEIDNTRGVYKSLINTLEFIIDHNVPKEKIDFDILRRSVLALPYGRKTPLHIMSCRLFDYIRIKHNVNIHLENQYRVWPYDLCRAIRKVYKNKLYVANEVINNVVERYTFDYSKQRKGICKTDVYVCEKDFNNILQGLKYCMVSFTRISTEFKVCESGCITDITSDICVLCGEKIVKKYVLCNNALKRHFLNVVKKNL